jgi:hypothetical protein
MTDPRQMAGHVAFALAHHRRRMAASGVVVPPELEALCDVRILASSGPGSPALGAFDAMAEVGFMSTPSATPTRAEVGVELRKSARSVDRMITSAAGYADTLGVSQQQVGRGVTPLSDVTPPLAPTVWANGSPPRARQALGQGPWEACAVRRAQACWWRSRPQ